MKIAFLSFFSGVIQRGVETLIEELTPRLAKNNELVVFQAGKKKESNYRVEYIPTAWRPEVLEQPLNLKRRLYLDKTSLAIRDFTKKALPILKREKFDVIIPWNNGWQTVLIRFLRVGKTVVVGQAGLGWDDRVNLWLFPDCFVGFTDYQCQWARKVNPFVKVEKIPNGVNIKRFSVDGEKLNIDLPRPIILVVAALVPMKRLDLVIKAVAGLKQGSLLLVGRGELKGYLEDLGKKLLPGRFKITSLPHNEIVKAYRSVDLFTYPTSNFESFGIVLLEAMATNLPIVANDDPIRREIVGDAGLFVNPEDTISYTRVLSQALEISFGEKPKKQAQKYNWDEIAKKYLQLFGELVK